MSDDLTCCCDLHDVTTYPEKARGEVTLIRGNTRGCPIHETPELRAERLRWEEAEATRAAVYAEAERKARCA